ncbi:MAG TPA: hypoxanthine phosphoribosyltransferase [Bacteroidales bacterium]|nr:hypoxanthine phosphoribosyltransferase [Bacteroidales bacterium]HPT20505.1 hypoxanthine phosphoribosyltransferase [Bacteroidales bacterium]
MKEITILDKKFKEFIPEKDIEKRIGELADQINKDYKGKDVVFVGILNGAFLFAAELFKRIDLEAKITFVKLASYTGTKSSGSIKELIGWNENIQGKNVIIIEDIVDTGHTLERIIDELVIRKVAEVKIATLLFKPEAYTKKIPVDYAGFEIPNNFVVGYGLDYDGYGRNLPSVYTLIL